MIVRLLLAIALCAACARASAQEGATAPPVTEPGAPSAPVADPAAPPSSDGAALATTPAVEPAPQPQAEPQEVLAPSESALEPLAPPTATDSPGPPPPPPPPPPPQAASDAPLEPAPSFLDKVQIHGFVSEGGFVSTDNEYIGASSRGSLKFFDAGINVTIEPTDRLRAGVQLVSRSVGTLSEELPRLDWALLEYRFARFFGARAGVIKIPLGLYNEYVDIDSARTSILMPQSVYPIRNRDALISHTGFSLFGNADLGPAGQLSYQAWLGVLSIPRSALELDGATLDSVDSHYATGAQLYWHLPWIEGLRIGGSFMRAVIDFNLTLAEDSVTALVMAGALPAGHDGSLLISQDPTSFYVGSIEYLVGDWLFAAEYSRALKLQKASLPALIPTLDEDSERFYAMVTYRLSSLFELGTYFSVVHADVNDRRGRGDQFPTPGAAFQRDLAASLRLDVNRHWLWKLEGHFIDGHSELSAAQNPDPERRWGLFLLRTTVTF